ncbi:MAG: restriction endonuclease subunit S [Tissierellia bacterium]|nr:restriction endonuclease subunit S [Tissierellia bacterium]
MVKEKVKDGYKKTIIGILPEDWNVNRLFENSSLKARIGWQGLTTAEYLDTGDYFLITGTDFNNGRIDWNNCHYVSKQRYNQDKNIQIKLGDVLVTKDGTIGKVAYIDKILKEATLNSGVFVIRPIDNAYNPEYFYHVLMSSIFTDFLNKLSAGSTISHLYQKDFIHFSFPVPNLLVQKVIAETLTNTDNLIQSLQKLIDKKKKIKQGTMQQLLTGKKRLPGFSGEWETKKFDNIFIKIPNKKYQLNSLDYNDYGKYPIIDQGKTLIIGYSDNSDKVFENNNKNVIVFGDHTRIFKYINFDFIVGADGTQLLKVKNEYNAKYFYYQLLTKEIPNTGYNRHFKFLKEFSFHVPSIEEQHEISKILTDIDSEIESLQQKLEKYKKIKQGMMQELLTGRIRLV